MQTYINTSFKNWNESDKSYADASRCFSADPSPSTVVEWAHIPPTREQGNSLFQLPKRKGHVSSQKGGNLYNQPQKWGFGFPVMRIRRVDASYWNSIGKRLLYAQCFSIWSGEPTACIEPISIQCLSPRSLMDKKQSKTHKVGPVTHSYGHL